MNENPLPRYFLVHKSRLVRCILSILDRLVALVHVYMHLNQMHMSLTEGNKNRQGATTYTNIIYYLDKVKQRFFSLLETFNLKGELWQRPNPAVVSDTS